MRDDAAPVAAASATSVPTPVSIISPTLPAGSVIANIATTAVAANTSS